MSDIIFKMTNDVKLNLGYTNSVIRHSSQWLLGEDFNPALLNEEHTAAIIKAMDKDLVMDGALVVKEYAAQMSKGVLIIYPRWMIDFIKGLSIDEIEYEQADDDSEEYSVNNWTSRL